MNTERTTSRHWLRTGLILGAIFASIAAAQGSGDHAAPAGWLEAATGEILRLEYNYTQRGDLAWSAPNRAQAMGTRFDQHGLELSPRNAPGVDADAPWKLRLRLAAFGREGRLEVVDPVTPIVDGNRIEYRYAPLTEWYVNDERGLEQGFTILAPPHGADPQRPLVVEMELGGGLKAYPSEDRQSIVLKTTGGETVLRYSKLMVEDGAGDRLPAELAAAPLRLRIRIDDRGAVYPLRVDPLFTSPSWTVEGDKVNSHFGAAAATAGDVNGDGYSDVVIGAFWYDLDPALIGEGAAFVYHGSASGLALTPSATIVGNLVDYAMVGASVSTAGDVNGDGYDDVIVGARQEWIGQAQEGAVYVYHGSPSGIGTTWDWRVEGDVASGELGTSVAWAGDVNDDGYDDVIAGAPWYWDIQPEEGRVFLWYGGPGGLGGAGTVASADWYAESNLTAALFGGSVGTAGDVDGDGFDDVIVGSPDYRTPQIGDGGAFVWYGSANGLPLGASATNADWRAISDQPDSKFGNSVATAGDVDGDGYADIVIGARRYDGGDDAEGALFVYHGGPSGLGADASQRDADWRAEGQGPANQLGSRVGTAGDVNGDGFADIITGSLSYAAPLNNEGGAFVWHGGPNGLGALGTPANADWSAEGNQVFGYFGSAAATAGDVDGDGFSDIIVGAERYDFDQVDEGGAFVFHGSPAGLVDGPSWNRRGGQDGAWLGWSVASAGDVNGDGHGDLIVGAPSFAGGQIDEGAAFVFHGSLFGPSATPSWQAESNQGGALFGSVVASTGDVNGDGYSDVLVGAPQYDNPEADEGAAFVWFGGAGGLGADGTPSNADWATESDQAGARLGAAAASAGDVNGDGFADLIVGSPLRDKGQPDIGAADLFFGSATGPVSDSHWSSSGSQAGAQFGGSVASAGDVNGDGFSDVLVGEAWFDGGHSDEGRMHLYLGSASGVGSSADWTAESDMTTALFGLCVASAGDVNGDGYSDVIAGSIYYTNSHNQEGAAFVWYGDPAGMGPAGRPSNADWSVESDQTSAFLGSSVASAGDVNADGYSDVVIGAPNYDAPEADEGAIFVWYGSASGLGPPASVSGADWSHESDQAGALLGRSAAGAGDVNADGFADIVVGAYRHDDNFPSLTDEGKVFVFHGNDGDKPYKRARQARADGSAPIDVLGKSDADDGFRLRAKGRSPAGRTNVRLEWEVKPLGTPFDGSGLATGSTFDDTGAPIGSSASSVDLDELVTGLAPATRYHWRSRIVTESPYFPRSPWLSLAYNNRSETDLMTGGFPDVDQDGFQNDVDCDDANPAVWDSPGEAQRLSFGADKITLEWLRPSNPGSLPLVLVYDTVVTSDPADFDNVARCIETDGADTSTADSNAPAPGAVFYYLVRAGNPCGEGAVGRTSTGIPRIVAVCP